MTAASILATNADAISPAVAIEAPWIVESAFSTRMFRSHLGESCSNLSDCQPKNLAAEESRLAYKVPDDAKMRSD